MDVPPLLSYPARPVNGGRLEDAPPKVGPWVYQPKVKDWRAIVHAPTRRIWNRHGQPMSIEADLAPALMILSGHPFEWLDVGVLDRQNQLLRGSIVIFDWIPREHPPSTFRPDQAQRRTFLGRDFDILPHPSFWKMAKPDALRGRVFLVSQCPHDDPEAYWLLLQRENALLGGDSSNPTNMKNFYEGLVAKRTDKPYPIQLLDPKKETPWMMKHRFDQ